MSSKPKLVAQYRDYSPPVDVSRSLRVLLRNVPAEHLVGLYRITLTNSECVKGSYRGKLWSEKRRIRPSDCLGLYHNGHILLLMDQIFLGCPEVLLLLPVIKTFVIGEVLYHEIGHHIHRIQEPGYRADREAFADQWKDTLMNQYLRRHYWYLAGLVRLVAACLHPIVRRWGKYLAKDIPSVAEPA